ncbi:hypothetical protein V1527DRAFT_451971 [Lipomyces starkeyi]
MSNRSLSSPSTSQSRIIFLPVSVAKSTISSSMMVVMKKLSLKIDFLKNRDSESTIDGSVDNVAGTDILPEESAS